MNTATNPTITRATTGAEEKAIKVADADKAARVKAEIVAEKSEPMVALNLIVQTGADGKPEDVLPGAVFRPATADLAFLTKTESIRQPTDGERALFERSETAAKVAADSTEDALG